VRRYALWAPLLAGGSGAEWLFGYKFAHNDINLEDFRSRERMWDQTRHAIDFFHRHVPVRKTQPAPQLVSKPAQCLAQPGELYVVYLPEGGTTDLELMAGEYRVQWYDPRQGGELVDGAVRRIQGPGTMSLGQPPRDVDSDWAVLLTRLQGTSQAAESPR